MPRPRPISALMAVVCVLTGCAGGEDVTVRSLANARRTWDAAKIRDYNLEWTSSGERAGHYLVFVRDGDVKAIRQYVEDSRSGAIREIEARPGDPSYYGVEGLFKILDEERAQLRDDRPFGQPKGATVVLRFAPDPRLGYPKRYRRDVVGSPKGLALDVLRLVPNPPAAIPPPPS